MNLIERIRTNQKLWDADEPAMLEIYDYLIKLENERDLLFKAHSHEMKRADELQIECDRLYRIIELNGKIADRVYDFDNPLLDVCKHGNDSACKECYLETVKK